MRSEIAVYILALLVIKNQQVEGAYDNDLNCLVCEVLVQEIEKAVNAVDPKKMVDLGGRIEADGSMKMNKKQLRRSEVHLTELFEDVCERMDDYAQGHWKDTEEKDLLPIIVNGQMNPRMSEFELLKDSNLNKGIKDYCQTIVEEKEDELMEFHSTDPGENAAHMFCSHVTDICPQHVHNDGDDDDEDDDDLHRVEL